MRTDNDTAELILEHLRALRQGQDDMRQALSRHDANFRALEGRLNTIGEDVQNVYRILTNHGGEFDHIRQRLNRIETRLDIFDDVPGH